MKPHTSKLIILLSSFVSGQCVGLIHLIQEVLIVKEVELLELLLQHNTDTKKNLPKGPTRSSCLFNTDKGR